MNPYWNTSFLEFFAVFFKRIFILIKGGDSLAFDEIQLFAIGGIAICCGVLGPFLVLRRMTMIANSMSHTTLLGVALSYLLYRTYSSDMHFPLYVLLLGALLAACLTVFFVRVSVRVFHIYEEASVGLVFTTLFALGALIVGLSMRDVHLGTEIILGNCDALSRQDLAGTTFLACVTVGVAVLFFWPLQCAAFDRGLSAILGVRLEWVHRILLLLTALCCVGSFRAVGVLLVLSFLVTPYLIARLFVHRLAQILILSPVIGVCVTLIGVAFSRHILTTYQLALSTGGLIATLLASMYLLACWMQKRLKVRA